LNRLTEVPPHLAPVDSYAIENPAFLKLAEEAPMTHMERLAARSAEKYGRRFTREF